MIRLAGRVEELERKSKGNGGPVRAVRIVGTVRSDAAVTAFLEQYGIDRVDDTLLIIVRSLVVPDHEAATAPADVPLGFLGAAPEWIQALSAYRERHI